MSQAGRYAHEQNTKRHAQRTVGVTHQRQAETVETATWLSDSMACCRALAHSQDNSWSIADFAVYSSVTYEEAERRLRYMAKLGFLHMYAERSNGKFVGYWFAMENINLPK